MASNPRTKNGYLRRKYRKRFMMMEAECGICHGRLGRVRYDQPSDSKHPLSFVIDEIIPISKWREAGFNSPEEAAQTFSNLQAAHYICNQMKSNKINFVYLGNDTKKEVKAHKRIELDGNW